MALSHGGSRVPPLSWIHQALHLHFLEVLRSLFHRLHRDLVLSRRTRRLAPLQMQVKMTFQCEFHDFHKDIIV